MAVCTVLPAYLILPASTKRWTSSLTLLAIFVCFSSSQKMTDAYWVPTSLPCEVVRKRDNWWEKKGYAWVCVVAALVRTCLSLVVGSWNWKKKRTKGSKLVSGSLSSTHKTSTWPVSPEQTCGDSSARFGCEPDNTSVQLVCVFRSRNNTHTYLFIGRVFHGLGVGAHESNGGIFDGIGKGLLEVLDNEFFYRNIIIIINNNKACECVCVRACTQRITKFVATYRYPLQMSCHGWKQAVNQHKRIHIKQAEQNRTEQNQLNRYYSQ